MSRTPQPRLLAAVLVAVLALADAPGARADGHLEAGEVAALAAAPAALLWLGSAIHGSQADRPPRWTEPPGIDRWAAVHLAPAPRATPANFMDSDLAGAIDVVAMGAAVGWLDATYPWDDPGRDFLQGQLVYWSGYGSMVGVQEGVKSLVGRQRPLWRQAPEVAALRRDVSPSHHRQSFWSGHAAGAFYGATFLNLRLRAVMRGELSAGQWKSWNWVPPAVLFTWASWVGYSRIHAHQHYLTDVLVGAGVGAAAAALFASFDDGREDSRRSSPQPVPLVTFALPF
ncbi:MAG TPA: phosphatase PAP2 family protein [Candidatus Krumholzibacteria bacterium]|nr:phosphatase PAP2 family protein [Candidatus Krumholzibacteria bacterium]HPD71967.1 phosphatase PAP2 family protein [Candidatus Krumholzibacteria bacterium]HRY41100.1 phosphatase PAP2 family protein [Candidatus Krumholzibacteria bacterium]